LASGPVWDHAEWGVIVLPTYSDPWYREHGHPPNTKPWSWLQGVNRTLSQVFKSLVLVYVDIPPPSAVNIDADGIVAVLQKYKVREIMVKRWSPNRNRG